MEQSGDRTVALWVSALLGTALGACVGWLGRSDVLVSGALVVPIGDGALWTAAYLCFFRASAWVAAIFLLGFSAILSPVVWAMPMLRGLGIGLAGAVALRGEGGFFLAMRVLLPGALHLYLMVQCCRDALEQSAYLRGCLSGKQGNTNEGLRGYLLRFVAWLALTVIVSAAEAGAALAAGVL